MNRPILWSDVYSSILNGVKNDSCAFTAFKRIDAFVRSSTVVSFYDEETESIADEIDDARNRMCQWLLDASGRYSPLIEALKSNKDKLLSDVDTTSRSWFNDAPSARNADSSGEDLSHLSTYSKSVSSSAYGTPMQRIKELDDEIMDIYERWAREFISAFSLEREC